MRTVALLLLCALLLPAQPVQTSNPVLFVTQVPTAGFTSITQTFSNHNPWIQNAPRGGDLMIRYGDGTLRNLTREAGFGDTAVMQGVNSIAVRQPTVHWSGTKAVFSMVIGAPTKIWEIPTHYWQMYEVTGLGKGEKAVITKVPNQPANYNNISPIYGSDGKIIFTSDMPFNKAPHLYPQLDEYENAKVVSGLWSLDPVSGSVKLLQHSPSGSFYPIVDSYGRIIYTRWDHLQRDQQNDSDRKYGKVYGTFNWSSEAANSVALDTTLEVYPEPRDKTDPAYDSTMALHTFNQFFPWEINQDGSEEETVNHVGRHEFGGTYTDASFVKDPNLSYVMRQGFVKNQVGLNGDGGPFQIKEDPNNPGTYFAANAREFSRESAGQILKFTGGVGMNPEEMTITEITHPVTAFSAEDGETPNPNHSGHYRNPLPLSDGQLIVSHTTNNYANKDTSSSTTPKPRYNFRLQTMKPVVIGGASLYVADKYLTNGIVRSTQYYDGNNYIVSRTDTLWELDAVEVRATTVPPLKTEPPVTAPEKQVMTEEGIDEVQLRNWLKTNNLALIVSRNVTTRDRGDLSQPYNLKVENGVQSVGKAGTVYTVKYMQVFQGDLLRGQGGSGGAKTPNPGRRVLAQTMHDPAVKNPPLSGAPAGAVKLGTDGSMASFVPAARALSWQLTDPAGKGIVRERYWVTFQPGEIRTCASCHGVNAKDQAGNPPPQNKPEALRSLLQYWKTSVLSVHGTDNVPSRFALEQNFPNPFNPSTTIRFDVASRGHVSLTVTDALGREVRRLVEEVKEPGRYSTEFDARGFASGVYFYTLRSGRFTETKRLLLLK